MALVVETGLGVTGADSYAAVAEADQYWADRGGAADWGTATEQAKEAALRLASEYIDIHYLAAWGEPLLATQGLAHPTTTSPATALNTVKRATIMLAPLALGGPLVALAPADGPLVSYTDKVGEISESRTYAQPTSGPTVVNGRDVTFLDRMLASLSGGGLVVGHRYRG